MKLNRISYNLVGRNVPRRNKLNPKFDENKTKLIRDIKSRQPYY